MTPPGTVQCTMVLSWGVDCPHMWVAYTTGSRRAGSGVVPPRAALSSVCVFCECGHGLGRRTVITDQIKSRAQDGRDTEIAGGRGGLATRVPLALPPGETSN